MIPTTNCSKLIVLIVVKEWWCLLVQKLFVWTVRSGSSQGCLAGPWRVGIDDTWPLLPFSCRMISILTLNIFIFSLYFLCIISICLYIILIISIGSIWSLTVSFDASLLTTFLVLTMGALKVFTQSHDCHQNVLRIESNVHLKQFSYCLLFSCLLPIRIICSTINRMYLFKLVWIPFVKQLIL